MNWKTITFDWNQIRAFLVTAEEGSFSAASKALGLTQPTLGRQVAALEEELNVVLFERIGRSLELTPSGLELLEHVRTMGNAAKQISLIATGQSQSIEGTVKITVSDIFANYLLPPFIEQLYDAAPNLQIEIIAVNDIRDLQRHEADIAIRNVRPEQPNLIAKLVNEASAHFYASKTYLKKYGHPKSHKDASKHRFLSFGNVDEMITHMELLGCKLTQKNFHFNSGNGIFVWEMAKRGHGICPMSDKIAEQSPNMERVFPDIQTMIYPIWLLSHSELHKSRRIRLVYDLLAEFLSKI